MQLSRLAHPPEPSAMELEQSGGLQPGPSAHVCRKSQGTFAAKMWTRGW